MHCGRTCSGRHAITHVQTDYFMLHALLSQSWGNPRRSAQLLIEANQDAILCLFVYLQLSCVIGSEM
jgi:hypothetical protein